MGQPTGKVASNFYFATDEMRALGAANRESFRKADPFPHIVIDDFLPAEVIEDLVGAFPSPDDVYWERFNANREVKLAFADETQTPMPVRHILQQFNTAPFVEFLEALTGLNGVIPDPHLVGGGLHQIVPGGYLKVHADFNRHDRLELDRRLNALLYLNEGWDEGWGGHLELWDRTMTSARARIAPVANRLVVFATTDFSYHGHPDPLRAPTGVTRKSMAFYYYTNGRPVDEATRKHTTLFQRRPGEDIGPDRPSLRSVARRSVPPILLDAARVAKARRSEH